MKPHIAMVAETPESSRSKRLSTIISSAATQSLFHQQARIGQDTKSGHDSTVLCVQDTPDHENAHSIFMEKKMKYSRRKDITSNFPSEDTFVQQSEEVLSSTILPGSPLFVRKCKEQTQTQSSSMSSTRRKSRDESLPTQKINSARDKTNLMINDGNAAWQGQVNVPGGTSGQPPAQLSTPTNNPGNLNVSSSSSSRRKKGKPCKIVAWDKLESVDPLATSVFRNNQFNLNENNSVICDKSILTDAKNPVNETKNQDAKNDNIRVQEEKIEKKIKKRESISRNRRLSNLNSESLANYFLNKEKTPSPGTRLLKEKIAANLEAEDNSDEEITDSNKRKTSNSKLTSDQKFLNGANRKSIFISGNVKSRTKEKLQTGDAVSTAENLKSSDTNKPQPKSDVDDMKRPKSRKNLSKELGSESSGNQNSSLLAVPLAQESRRGRRSNALQGSENSNGRVNISLMSKTNSEGSHCSGAEEGSTISVSGISGLSFQNFSSDSAKAVINRIEKEGWNSDIEKQLTGEKCKNSDANSTSKQPNNNPSTCDKISKSVNTRKSLKRRLSDDIPDKSGKKGKFESSSRSDDAKKCGNLNKVGSVGGDDMDLIGATPQLVRGQAIKVRNDQKTSLTPEPMELCDSPARRSGRKSTQASTLASDGLLKSPALLKQSKVASGAGAPTESSTTTEHDKPSASPKQKEAPASTLTNKMIPSTSKKTKNDQNNVCSDGGDDKNTVNEEEELPATQKPPLFENLVFFVEVMNGRYNMSSSIEKMIKEHGGSCVKKLCKKTTHVIFHFGTRANYLRSKKLGLPILSAAFVSESVKQGRLLPASQHPSINIEDYDKGKFPSLRKLKSYTIRPTEERMQIIEEKFQRKKRKEERERAKEEARKKAAQRPKPVYYPPLYYEGSPYMKQEKPEDKVAKILKEIKSPTGSPLRMEYFKAPTTPVWEDENEINLSLADRLLYRYKKNKAIDAANKSGSKLVSPLADSSHVEPGAGSEETLNETPCKKILESSNLDTTRKPRRLHRAVDTTAESTINKSINTSKIKRNSKNTTIKGSKRKIDHTQDSVESAKEKPDEIKDSKNDEKREEMKRQEVDEPGDDSSLRRRSGRASTQLATKVSNILAKQETSPANKLSSSLAKKNNDNSKVVQNTKSSKDAKSNERKKQLDSDAKAKSSKDPPVSVDKAKESSESNMKIPREPTIKKMRGRKLKNIDEELEKATREGNFGKPNLESTRLSVLDSDLNPTKDQRSSKKEQSPAIRKPKLKVTEEPASRARTKSDSANTSTSPKSAAEIENDRIFDALLSSKFGASTSKKSPIEIESGKKKFLLNVSSKTAQSSAPGKSSTRQPAPTCPSPRNAPSSCPSPRASPRHATNYPSPRASPRHATTYPSPSASPRQDSGSSPRHQQSSSPRPLNKGVEWLSSRQWGGSNSRVNTSAVLTPSAASIYQSSLANTKKSEVEPETVPVTLTSPKSTNLSSPETTPTKKAKVIAPWRRNQESSPSQQNVSKDNVYDFEGFPDELDSSRVPSTQCIRTFQPTGGSTNVFSVSPTKPQGTFLLRSKRSAPALGKLNLNSVLKSQAQLGSQKPRSNGVTSSSQRVPISKPMKNKTNSDTQNRKDVGTLLQVSTSVAPAAGTEYQAPAAGTQYQALADDTQHQALDPGIQDQQLASSSGEVQYLDSNKVSTGDDRINPPTSRYTHTTRGYEKPRDKLIASFELENSIRQQQTNVPTNGDLQSDFSYRHQDPDPQSNELSADKPQRAAKKALLSRIFNKPPPKEADDQQQQMSPGKEKAVKDQQPSTPDKETQMAVDEAVSQENEETDETVTASNHGKPSTTQPENLKPEFTSDLTGRFLSHRKRKLYSQDVLDETAKNSPSSAHQGLKKAPYVENVHLKTSKSSKTDTSEFKRPETKSTAGKKKKKKRRSPEDDEGTEDKEDNEKYVSKPIKKGELRASRRSSAEFAPLPRFLKKMEEKSMRDSSSSSSSSDSSKRRRGVSRNIVCTSCSQEDVSLVQQLIETYGKYNLSTAVNSRTSHVISGEGKRTLNLLKGLLSGCWLVTREWVVASLEAGHWVDEEPYEMVDFSPAVKTLRIERDTWRDTFKSELFKEVGAIYISPNCRAPRDELKQLVHAGGGLVTSQQRIAQVVVGECSKSGSVSETSHVTEKWILDSVQFHMVLPFSDYPIR